MRQELSTALRTFFDDLDFEKPLVEISGTDPDWLAELVTLATRCRSYVVRNSYNRQIEDPGDSEGPGRMMRALSQLSAGLELIGIGHIRRRELLQRVALDSMPPARRIAFDCLAAAGQASTTVSEIAKTSHYPEQSVRRALQDLECHEVVVRKSGKPDLWRIADESKQFCVGLKVKPRPIVSSAGTGCRASVLPEDDE